MIDKRKFFASFSVRFDTKRTKFELANATNFGGSAGLVRVRIDRVWHDGRNGEMIFFDKEQLADFLASYALGDIAEPSPMPDVPKHSRVSVRYYENDGAHIEGGFTSTTPILASDGYYYVWVGIYGGGRFIKVNDIIKIHNKRR